MTVNLPEKALGSSLFEDLERMSLSLNRAFPNSDARSFDYLLKAIDAADEESSLGGKIVESRKRPPG